MTNRKLLKVFVMVTLIALLSWGGRWLWIQVAVRAAQNREHIHRIAGEMKATANEVLRAYQAELRVAYWSYVDSLIHSGTVFAFPAPRYGRLWTVKKGGDSTVVYMEFYLLCGLCPRSYDVLVVPLERSKSDTQWTAGAVSMYQRNYEDSGDISVFADGLKGGDRKE
jgi:hypothetical protein